MRGRLHKGILAIVLAVFFSTSVLGGVLFFPGAAQAQLDSIGGPITAGIIGPRTVKKETEFSFGSALGASFLVAIGSAIDQFAQQFAYDLAVGLASGLKGQNPLAFLQKPGDYFTTLGQDAAGTAIGTLGDAWGVDLCNPRIPDVALSIGLGIAERFQRPKPRCNWANIVNNYDKLSQEVQDPKALLKHVSASFDPGESDLSQALQAQEAVTAQVAKAISTGLTEWAGQGGIRSVEDKISGAISTPARVVQKGFDALGPDLPYTSRQGVQQQAASIVSNPEAAGPLLGAIGTNMMSVFVNTLAARTMKTAFEGLFSLLAPTEPIDLRSLVGGGSVGSSVQKARAVASDLLVAGNFNTISFDIAGELSTCPDKAETGTQFSCALDSSFAQAVRAASQGNPMTVAEAIEKKLLDPSKPFGFTDPESGLEPDARAGYGYSNMKKLRVARVIPIGWELAALEARRLKLKPTLGDVVGGFRKAGNNGICGSSVNDSPFCGLVDPNWVLKAPLAQCAARAFGSITDAQGYRQEVCADFQHCIAEDGSGNCRAWGYCTREANVWSIKGDACEAQYASCESYRSGDGKKNISLLESTLDFGVCNADNAGCKWYSRLGDPSAAFANWLDADNARDRVYLDLDAQVCKAQDAGCAEFLPASEVRENLIPNPSFERDEDGDGAPDGWDNLDATGVKKDNALARHGGVLAASDDDFRTEFFPLQSGVSYTLSAHSRGAPGVTGASRAILVIKFYKDITGGEVKAPDLPENFTCEEGLFNDDYRLSIRSTGSAYARRDCTFIAPGDAHAATITIKDSVNILLDALQLEQGVVATDFRDGYAPNPSPSLYIKAPPAWLGCDGEPNEPAECANFARVCRQEEVGCERYAPTNGDPAIPGVITDQDQCPAECVGYASYKQEGTNFAPAVFPEYLIPSKAQSCAIEQVGCSQFTNLTSEAIEYYSSLRACQRPSADDGVYYTWEGAEQTGYQLRTWRLKQSDVILTASSVNAELATTTTGAKPPCTNANVLSDTPDCKDAAAAQAVCTAAELGVNPDCRAFYDKNGNIFYRLYSRTVSVSDQCNKYRASYPDVALDSRPLCEKFGGQWNTAFNGFCRLPVAPNTPAGSYAQLACQLSHGSWDGTKKECLFAGLPTESTQCPAEANSCRLFSGNAGNNVQTVLGPETFEGGQGGWAGGSVVAESSSLGGHSLKIVIPKNADKIATVPLSFAAGENYLVSAWVKSAGGDVDISARFGSLSRGANNGSSGIQTASSDWKLMNFGPIRIVNDIGADTRLFVVARSGSAANVYLDNIIVRQVKDTLPLLANSITIPASCDRQSAAAGGGYLPQAMLGCAAYNNRAGDTQNLKSFSRFCREEAVGCRELIDTHNSSQVEARKWNDPNSGTCRGSEGQHCCYDNATASFVLKSGDPSTTLARACIGNTPLCTIGAGQTSCSYSGKLLSVDNQTVPQDSHRYLVADNTKMKCAKESRGCEALGYKNPATGAWGTVYLKNNPDDYGRILCSYEEDKCAAWTSGAGTAYFKDPTESANGLCEWRTQVNIGGVEYNGWFLKGSAVPCYGNATDTTVDFATTYTKNGAFGIWNNLDAKYAGRAGECPRQQAGCTEFLDPADTVTYSAGRPYYYIDNGKLDRQSCNGSVSQVEGCVLFNQSDVPQKNWIAKASYQSSDDKGGALVKPVDARTAAGDGNDSNTILKVQRDRTCAEWLSCRSAAVDPVSGQTICNYYGRCSALGLGESSAASPECNQWEVPPAGKEDGEGMAQVTTVSGYKAERSDVAGTEGSWYFHELSGYSLPGQRPVEWAREYVQTNADDTCNVATGFCKKTPSRACQTDNDCAEPVRLAQYNPPLSNNKILFALADADPFTIGGLNQSCASDATCGAGYICDKNPGQEIGACVVPKSCRGYPAINAPVSSRDFPKADNTCEKGNCECSYIQYQSKGTSAYYPFGAAVSLICTQGSTPGKTCTADSDCAVGAPEDIKGFCSPVDGIKQYVGWRGYCLEYAATKAVGSVGGAVGGVPARQCLTWAPIVAAQGESTAFLQAPTADYRVALGKEWYCTDGEEADAEGENNGQELSKTAAFVIESDNYGYTIAGEGQPGSIGDINNFFDKPFYKDSSPVTSENLADGKAIKSRCGGDGANAPGQWCAVPMEGFESYFYRSKEDSFKNADVKSNFLGCYGLNADDGGETAVHPGNFLFFPYKHKDDAPIYAHTIKSITLTFSDKDDKCDNTIVSREIRGDDDAWGTPFHDGEGKIIILPTLPVGREESFQNIGVIPWKGTLGGADGAITALVKFDPAGKFLGIEIEAHDYDGTGTFAISKFQMRMKPACKKLVKIVSDDSRIPSQVYSDNIREEKIGTVEKSRICEPFGATAIDPKLLNLKNREYTGLIVPPSYQTGEAQCAVGYGATDLPSNFVLNNIFAKEYKVLELARVTGVARNKWDTLCSSGPGFCYKELDPNATGVIDKTKEGSPPAVTDMKVNSKPSGDVTVNDTSVFPVNLSFFGGPNKDQMPIRRIQVDWGDSTPIFKVGDGTAQSSYKARFESCDNSDFAHSPDACEERPFSFSHTYFCPPGGEGVSQWDNDLKACVFKPRVQIYDNWGHCNGVCAGKTGCYEYECDGDNILLDNKPWKEYNGRIIVRPPEETP